MYKACVMSLIINCDVRSRSGLGFITCARWQKVAVTIPLRHHRIAMENGQHNRHLILRNQSLSKSVAEERKYFPTGLT